MIPERIIFVSWGITVYHSPNMKSQFSKHPYFFGTEAWQWSGCQQSPLHNKESWAELKSISFLLKQTNFLHFLNRYNTNQHTHMVCIYIGNFYIRYSEDNITFITGTSMKKNQLDVTFCILYFSPNSCSTCFGQPCAHHQELTTAWCYSLVLVCAVAAGRWSCPVGR